MSRFAVLFSAGAILSLACFGAGCDSSTPPPPVTGDGHAHEHAHDHAHAGPHGGHIIEIGAEEYHAEMTHTEDGKITIYVLDSELKKEVPIPAEKIRIDVKIGDKPQSFELAAVDRSTGDMPTTAKFETVDKQLLGVLESLSPKGVTATLKLEIGGKPYAAPIEPAGEHKH